MGRPGFWIKLCVLGLCLLGLKGCIGAATVAGAAAGSLAVQTTIRNNNMDLALQGDPVAQTKVGSSYCCAGPGFSAQKATEWLCKAADQEHMPAFYELGRIYIGEVTRIPHPGLYITAEVTSKKSLPIGLMYLQLAADAGNRTAARKIRAQRAKHNGNEIFFDRQLDQANALKATWRNQPCTYSEVFA